jgi:hypothetical protein
MKILVDVHYPRRAPMINFFPSSGADRFLVGTHLGIRVMLARQGEGWDEGTTIVLVTEKDRPVSFGGGGYGLPCERRERGLSCLPSVAMWSE